MALKKPAEAPTPQKAPQSPVKGDLKSPEKEPVAKDDSQESEAKTPKKRKAEDDCPTSGEDPSSKKSSIDLAPKTNSVTYCELIAIVVNIVDLKNALPPE